MKYIIILITTVIMSGCYSNWPLLNRTSKAITCDMDKTQLDKIAKKYWAQGTFDTESNTYSISKADDAIAILFNNKEKIEMIVKTKSIITFGGLIRKQGDVVIVRRCD